MPAETFVDNVTRTGFDNWEKHQALYPDADSTPDMTYPRGQSHRQLPPPTQQQLGQRARIVMAGASPAFCAATGRPAA
ncbi:hypothetical protein ACELLULO517_07150 [Acidisoma cellulosilytica]|uniref:Uncharacterized protein n=1 Tax=Acidisoma cellulosilyticum TaxID=2802395 RepID=A0A964E2U5_9PROT|nr:hypothetical protein [Acidisoma cellulosilyticum]MCB8880005.1 hypothetical protein [Acidisoma cellulosilyticum]